MADISLLRFILAFAFVLGLIGLFALGLKKWGSRLSMVRTGAGGRLKVVEMCMLGARHRLVLVKRDHVEHLLLLSPDAANVVESGIKKE